MRAISIALLLVVLVMFGLAVGEYDISPARMLAVLSGQGSDIENWVLFDIRLVRMALAILCGAGLAISGAALQGMVRNSLAEPAVLGLSSGAALAAVLAYYFSSGLGFHVAIAAVAGAGGAAILVLMMAAGSNSSNNLVLAGAAISSLAGAGLTLVLSLIPNPFALADLTFWLMGSFADRSWVHFAVAAPCIISGMVLLFSVRHELVVMGFGEEAAISRGISINALRNKIIIASALIVGATVAVAGIIGFVGLVAPHLVRAHYGYNPARILLPSAFMGAALLLASDIAVRLLPLPSGELKIGVITALMGAPLFLAIIIRGQKC